MMKQVALRLEEDFIKQVKLRALEENTTFQAIVTKALEDYIAPKSKINTKELVKTIDELTKHVKEMQNLLGIETILTKI